MSDKVLLKSYSDAMKAKLIQIKLEESGISSFAINKQDSMYVVLGDIEIYVNRDDAPRASEILSEEE